MTPGAGPAATSWLARLEFVGAGPELRGVRGRHPLHLLLLPLGLSLHLRLPLCLGLCLHLRQLVLLDGPARQLAQQPGGPVALGRP